MSNTKLINKDKLKSNRIPKMILESNEKAGGERGSHATVDGWSKKKNVQ